MGLTDDDLAHGNLVQITLEESGQNYRRTYVAIARSSQLRDITLSAHMPLGVSLQAKGLPTGPAEWFVTSMTPVEQSD